MQIDIVSCCLEEGNLSFPLGALCIQTSLQKKLALDEQACLLYPYTLTDDPKQAALMAASRKSDFIGCSVYLWNRAWFDTFVTVLKKEHPSAVIFAGGTEVTANPQSFDLDTFCFLTLGEGEETTALAIGQLLRGEKARGQGILTKGLPVTFAYPSDLDSLPSVFLSGNADALVDTSASILWEMTRGCPFSCAFCFESKGLRSVRSYAYDRIEKELDYILAHQIEDVFILDPTFNMDKKRTVKMLSLLVEKAPSIHFTFELRAELLDEELADLFAQLNCSLQIGLQSSDKTILQAINRRFEPGLFVEKIDLLNQRGIVFGLDLIIGLPLDTYETFTESLNFAIGLKPSNIDIFALSLLPGTKLAEQASSLGLIYTNESPYIIEESKTYTKKDLEKALQLKDACDLFYTKGQACMWIHSLCEATDLKSSEILLLFNTYCDFLVRKQNQDIQKMDIYELQEQFVKALLNKLNRNSYLPALLSFMELHQGISFLQETGNNPVITVSYELDELALLDTQPIGKFVKNHPRQKRQTYGIFYEEDGSISFEEQKV
ncbi:Fe-S oxidoreductase [Sphaerochaeta pleomorpha str. Grapes]|uniref:Fe-S oxidoreductase n=1 Tax=Sphaerochaeta pleomorpha (strain ATCC BAA-1885 / DSM 22778 / Grapes) TaxID=158190 RepID=G8QVE5_SPHPG|nr:B12-binding domain-containing radical SAM protein [Sphaerochaeta pleomorpha]AEV30460.1 Fe-S oxidoreductase [Sphaerochaeta pleomorpha str. Grapes]